MLFRLMCSPWHIQAIEVRLIIRADNIRVDEAGLVTSLIGLMSRLDDYSSRGSRHDVFER